MLSFRSSSLYKTRWSSVAWSSRWRSDVALDLASDVLLRIAKKLHLTANLNPKNIQFGTRPVPIDGFPVVGNIMGETGVFVAVMHSGVTLAPLIGQLLASEMFQISESALLESFRPSRFKS